jgi:hypothetical protein
VGGPGGAQRLSREGLTRRAPRLDVVAAEAHTDGLRGPQRQPRDRVSDEGERRGQLAPPKEARVPARLPLLARPVPFAEVKARVFRKTCWHCHSDPDYAIGDGGPGNTGGFGFAPRGMNLAEYEGIASGALDENGERRSVFEKAPDGEARIVSALLARQREEAGQPTSATALRGMPLGLPALSPEDVQLVESWVAQGRPR